jgi:hypothetical protein
MSAEGRPPRVAAVMSAPPNNRMGRIAKVHMRAQVEVGAETLHVNDLKTDTREGRGAKHPTKATPRDGLCKCIPVNEAATLCFN